MNRIYSNRLHHLHSNKCKNNNKNYNKMRIKMIKEKYEKIREKYEDYLLYVLNAMDIKYDG